MDEGTSWKVTADRFVAFVDIMGFKHSLLNDGHDSVLQSMINMYSLTAPINDDAEKKLSGKKINNSGPAVKTVMFSDTILLISNDNSPSSANHILLSSAWLNYKALQLGIPIKGAIAFGKQTSDFNMSIHFGTPLIDAYELQDEIVLYGMVLHHSMEKHLRENNETNNHWITKYHTPMKTNTITHYLVN